MNKILSIIILTITAFSYAKAQDNANTSESQAIVDSLKLLANKAPEKERYKLYCEIAYNDYNADTCEKYGKLSLPLAEKYNDTATIIRNCKYIGWATYYSCKYEESIKFKLQGLQLCEKIGDKNNYANLLLNIGNCYADMGVNESMWDYYYKAIHMLYQINDTADILYGLRIVGNQFINFKMFNSAYEYFQKAMKMDSATNKILDLAYDLSFMGFTKLQEHIDSNSNNAITKCKEALAYFEKSKQIFDNKTDKNYKYDIWNGRNNFYLLRCFVKLDQIDKQHNYKDSVTEYLKICKNWFKESLDKEKTLLVKTEEAHYLINNNKINSAIEILNNIRQKNRDSIPRIEQEVSQLLVFCYESKGNYIAALEEHKKYINIVQDFSNTDQVKRSAEFAAKIRLEQEMIRIENEQNKNEIIRNAELKQQKIITFTSFLGIILLITIIILISRLLANSKKANKMLNSKNTILQNQQAEITRQRDMFETQKTIAENSNKQIRDSLEYAKRLQKAVLPTYLEVRDTFSDSFVFFKPRDIVSGDFYITLTIDKLDLLIEADCTGHGVPGALLSMMGISALKDIIAQMVSDNQPIIPGIILDKLRIFVKNTINKDKNDNTSSSYDGMDITVCIFDKENMVLNYACANQTPIIVRNSKADKLKCDNMPIGNYIFEKDHFSTHKISLEKGDCIYIFSDGIKDLLSENREKFTYTRLKNFFETNCNYPMQKQYKLMVDMVDNWLNGGRQIDDITVIGIRI